MHDAGFEIRTTHAHEVYGNTLRAYVFFRSAENTPFKFTKRKFQLMYCKQNVGFQRIFPFLLVLTHANWSAFRLR